MRANNMGKSKVIYIIHSILGIGVYTILTIIVSIKFYNATQMELYERLFFIGFLWITVIFFIYELIKHYRKNY